MIDARAVISRLFLNVLVFHSIIAARPSSLCTAWRSLSVRALAGGLFCRHHPLLQAAPLSTTVGIDAYTVHVDSSETRRTAVRPHTTRSTFAAAARAGARLPAMLFDRCCSSTADEAISVANASATALAQRRLCFCSCNAGTTAKICDLGSGHSITTSVGRRWCFKHITSAKAVGGSSATGEKVGHRTQNQTAGRCNPAVEKAAYIF